MVKYNFSKGKYWWKHLGKDTPNPPNAVKNGFCVQSKQKPNQEIKNGSPTSDIKMEKILEEADGQKN